MSQSIRLRDSLRPLSPVTWAECRCLTGWCCCMGKRAKPSRTVPDPTLYPGLMTMIGRTALRPRATGRKFSL